MNQNTVMAESFEPTQENIDLAIVMPVYNEEGAIEEVLCSWVKILKKLKISAHIHVYNDGSKDRTSFIIKELQNQFPQIILHNKDNSGHGPTIIQGLIENSHYPWILQVDSDDEIGAEQFEEFWKNHEQYDFLIGYRYNRKGPLSRRFISFVARIFLRTVYQTKQKIKDVNCPFRLMKTSAFSDYWKMINKKTFAPNIIISGSALLMDCKILEIPVHFRRAENRRSLYQKFQTF